MLDVVQLGSSPRRGAKSIGAFTSHNAKEFVMAKEKSKVQMYREERDSLIRRIQMGVATQADKRRVAKVVTFLRVEMARTSK